MQTDLLFGVAFWGFLVVYGPGMYAVSPQARTPSAFFGGTDDQGRAAGERALILSIFISWIFAKSITNAANLYGPMLCTAGFLLPAVVQRLRGRVATAQAT